MLTEKRNERHAKRGLDAKVSPTVARDFVIQQGLKC